MKKNNSSLNFFDALSPVDGRYFLKLQNLQNYFSEFSLFRYRILVEIRYLIFLSENKIIRKLNQTERDFLHSIYDKFDKKDFLNLKKIEDLINHDVKAVEYFLKEKFKKTSLKDIISFIHFGLTSEDINNLSYSLILKKFKENILEKKMEELINFIKNLSYQFKDQIIIARTHSQPAVPTSLGKEFLNYYYRLKKQFLRLKKFQFEGKLNGAVGNFNALNFVFPDYDWLKLSEKFISSFDLKPNPYTTQILFYDNYLEFFQMVDLVNGIIIDFSVNIWNYILLDILKQRKKEEEVGSSTMPQKLNPIDFEQAEGALGLSRSMLNFFIQKLTLSRLQRDLSDSIIRRFFGESLALTILGWQSFLKGLKKIYPNQEKINQEINENYQVLTEAIQTFLRLKNDDLAYEKVKEKVRGQKLSKADYLKLLKYLGLDDNKKLKELTPEKYVGYAKSIKTS